jgi:hypothetical protein
MELIYPRYLISSSSDLIWMGKVYKVFDTKIKEKIALKPDQIVKVPPRPPVSSLMIVVSSRNFCS